MIDFPGKQQDEEVLMIVRKHPVVYFKIIFSYFIVALFPVSLLFGLWHFIYGIDLVHPYFLVAGLFSSFYLLFWLLYISIAWINEEFDLFIITNQRLIDVTQVSLFKRTMSAANLENIEDTTGEVLGFFSSLFNYGTIKAHTASSTAADFFMDYTSDPIQKSREILNWVHAKKNKKPFTPSSATDS